MWRLDAGPTDKPRFSRSPGSVGKVKLRGGAEREWGGGAAGTGWPLIQR